MPPLMPNHAQRLAEVNGPDLPAMQLSPVDEMIKKQQCLISLKALEEKGAALTKKYTYDDPLPLMQGELKMQQQKKDADVAVALMMMAFQGILKTLEDQNRERGPFVPLPKDWAVNTVQANKAKLEHIMLRLYRKYWRKGPRSPIVDLLLLVGGALVTGVIQAGFKGFGKKHYQNDNRQQAAVETQRPVDPMPEPPPQRPPPSRASAMPFNPGFVPPPISRPAPSVGQVHQVHQTRPEFPAFAPAGGPGHVDMRVPDFYQPTEEELAAEKAQLLAAQHQHQQRTELKRQEEKKKTPPTLGITPIPEEPPEVEQELEEPEEAVESQQTLNLPPPPSIREQPHLGPREPRDPVVNLPTIEDTDELPEGPEPEDPTQT